MDPKVLHSAQGEERIASYLREDALSEIQRIDDLEEIGRKLDAPRVGVERLISRDPWDIQTALRIVEALGLTSITALEDTAAQYARDARNGIGQDP
jgi:hypothetical protein